MLSTSTHDGVGQQAAGLAQCVHAARTGGLPREGHVRQFDVLLKLPCSLVVHFCGSCRQIAARRDVYRRTSESSVGDKADDAGKVAKYSLRGEMS